MILVFKGLGFRSKGYKLYKSSSLTPSWWEVPVLHSSKLPPLRKDQRESKPLKNRDLNWFDCEIESIYRNKDKGDVTNHETHVDWPCVFQDTTRSCEEKTIKKRINVIQMKMLILTYEDPRPNDRSDNDRTSLNQSQGLLQPPGLLLHLLDLLYLSFSLSLNLEIVGWRNQNHLFLLFHSRIFALSVRSSHVGLRGKISSFANNQPSLIDKKMFCRKPIWQRKHSQVQVLELTFLVGWLGNLTRDNQTLPVGLSQRKSLFAAWLWWKYQVTTWPVGFANPSAWGQTPRLAPIGQRSMCWALICVWGDLVYHQVLCTCT